jgi:hypothetical protein
MLYIVLILVLAAFGLLVLALTTAFTLWAWLSVIVSVAAAALLVYDWLGGRRDRKEAPAERTGTKRVGSPPTARAAEPLLPVEPAEPAFQHPPEAAYDAPPDVPDYPPPPVQPVADVPPHDERTVFERPVDEQPLADRAPADERTVFERPVDERTVFEQPVDERTVFQQPPVELIDPDEEPGEEATDASDLLVVSDLAVEVRVVDEHPRYHLTQCGWLATKQSIPLPISEARELGFTPCAYCGPDAHLAARHRAERQPR